MQSPEITELDEQTVAQIAAGEVVERPASVVKELVENSLDAGADRIDVSVENGGIDRIKVRDNGHGMTEAAVRKAIKEHTTSKLDSADQLQRVTTLGFRGEALHTIGAVSKMEITTNAAETESATKVEYVGGTLENVSPAGHPIGTTVVVDDLFFNTPARRKYLSASDTEFRHISRVVGRYALANPDAAVSLAHNGSETFSTTGQGNRRSAVLSVYGRDVAEGMVPVDVTPDGPIDRIHGFISDPETTRASREYMATYVNGRYVEPEELRSAIVDGYGKQLAADRYPFTILFIELPADRVDINVHPRKLAVRFDDSNAVSDAVETAVRQTLLDTGLIRSSAPRGASAPSETTISPDRRSSKAIENRESVSEPPKSTASSEPSTTPAESISDSPPAPDSNQTSSTPSPPDNSDRSVSKQPTTQQTLTGEAPSTDKLDQIPSMSVLGQIHDTYIIAETDQGLLLIDQHAADERIHYERLTEAYEGETAIQTLADPVELSLTPSEAAVFDSITPALRQLGFHTQQDGETVSVTSVPTVFGETLRPQLIHELFDDILDDSVDEEQTVASQAEALLADLACAPAITGNRSLTDGSIHRLLEQLDTCSNPYECPHGRPTIIEIDRAELEERFERDYPGHQN